jgi:hypothetical protein
LGASWSGGSDIVEKHLGVVRQLKRSLEALDDVAECGVTAVDEGWKKEWSELCSSSVSSVEHWAESTGTEVQYRVLQGCDSQRKKFRHLL